MFFRFCLAFFWHVPARHSTTVPQVDHPHVIKLYEYFEDEQVGS